MTTNDARAWIVALAATSGCYDPTTENGDASASSSGSTSGMTSDPSATGSMTSTTATTSVDATTDPTVDPDSSTATGSGTDPVTEDSGSSTGGPLRCTMPEVLGTYPTASQTQGVSVFGSRGYVVETNFGLRILDLTDPSNPAQLGQLMIPNPMDVVARGTLVYVADPTGVYIVDATNAATPVQLGVIPAVDNHLVEGVAVDDAHIYWVDTDNGNPCPSCGLHIADVDTFAELGDVPLGDDPRDVRVEGTIAYVANGQTGLTTVDVSNPAAPAVLATLAIDGFASAIDVADGVAYVAAGSGGLHVFSVADPAAPSVLGSSPGMFALGVAVAGDWAWVADTMPGVSVLDVSDPSDIAVLGYVDSFASGSDVWADANLAAVTSWDNGVRVISPPECN